MEKEEVWYFLDTMLYGFLKLLFTIYIHLLQKLPANEKLKILTCLDPNYTPFL